MRYKSRSHKILMLESTSHGDLCLFDVLWIHKILLLRVVYIFRAVLPVGFEDNGQLF